MQSFTFLFKYLEELLTLYPFYGILGLNWSCDVTGRPEFSNVYNLDFIIEFPLPKLVVNAKFRLFIQIPNGIIDTLPILGYFLALIGLVTSQEGANFQNFKI